MSDDTVRRLTQYATKLRFDDLPAETVHQVKRLMVDSMGCAIGAFSSEPAKIVRDLAASVSGNAAATVIGTRDLTTPDLAAFANGTMVRYLDFNDAYGGKDTSHPSDNFPVVLAAAEAYNASGRDFITAAVLAYEVQTAFSDTYRMRDGGPWDQASYATVSAPLGAAKVMGLDEERMANALRLSVVQGLHLAQARRGHISHFKASAVPNAGRNGVFAAMLAERGFTGPPEAIEGEVGYFTALAGKKLVIEPLTGEKGHRRPFRIMSSRIKRYPSGFFSQTAIEAALECRQALNIAGGEQVRSVHIRTFQNTINAMAGDATRWRPQSRETADHSVPFVVAMALEHGRVEPAQFVDEVLQDARVQAAMDKVKVVLDPECDAAWPDAILNIVTVETTDGRSHTARVPYHLGHFKRPMSDADLEAKFRGLCRGLLTRAQQDIALAATWRLEAVTDLSEYLELFVV
jgi:2-methylcitrate dehydratase